jgi:protein phosphatase
VTHEANRQINELARRDKERSGMGTTLTAAMVIGDELSLAHVGDSRAYLFREGELRQLTTDHSLVEELRRQGRLTREEAAVHPQRSIITRALGPEPDVRVDTATFPARAGDVVLLCSDGLTAMVDDEQIREIIAGANGLGEAARGLVNEANRRGGRDNITVVIFRLEEVEEPAAVVDPNAEPVTLVGERAAREGLTADAVRRGAAERRVAASHAAKPVWKRLPWVRIAVAIAAVAVVLVAAIVGLRQVHFLGIDEGGRPALYRGLPYELPLGIDLYEERYSLPIQATDLPPERRGALTDHDLRSHGDAVNLLRDLEREVTDEPDRRGS